jgi:hypothetical protein
MTDAPADSPQPADQPDPDTLPPGGLPAEPQGDEVDPGTGRIIQNIGEDSGALEPQNALQGDLTPELA